MDNISEVKWAQTRGYGIFAKRPISSNTIILEESPILAVEYTPETPLWTDANIEAAFHRLSRKDQTLVLQLHEGSHPAAPTKVTRIFHANAFGADNEEKLYLKISRFNHSCVPNASMKAAGEGGGCIMSEKPIAAGEEITISYLPTFSEAMTARQRAAILQPHYNFKCRCVACWPPEKSWKSDVRRKLIGFLSYALKGENVPDFKPPIHRPRGPIRSGHSLNKTQEIEYNFLLARLREAEGLSDDLVADCYLRAATKLGYRQSEYYQNEITTEVVFLEAARCIAAWYQKGLELEKKYYGPDHEQVREGKAVWARSWSKLHCLEVLRLSSMVKAKDPSSYIPSKSGEEFAVLMNNQKFTMTLLSRDETATLVWQRFKK